MWPRERAATVAADGALYKLESVCSASVVAGSVKVLPNILRNRRVIGLREGAGDGVDTASDSIGGTCEQRRRACPLALIRSQSNFLSFTSRKNSF